MVRCKMHLVKSNSGCVQIYVYVYTYNVDCECLSCLENITLLLPTLYEWIIKRTNCLVPFAKLLTKEILKQHRGNSKRDIKDFCIYFVTWQYPLHSNDRLHYIHYVLVYSVDFHCLVHQRLQWMWEWVLFFFCFFRHLGLFWVYLIHLVKLYPILPIKAWQLWNLD